MESVCPIFIPRYSVDRPGLSRWGYHMTFTALFGPQPVHGKSSLALHSGCGWRASRLRIWSRVGSFVPFEWTFVRKPELGTLWLLTACAHHITGVDPHRRTGVTLDQLMPSWIWGKFLNDGSVTEGRKVLIHEPHRAPLNV